MPQTPVTDTIKINTTVLGAQFAPAIAVLSGGGYVIVWQDSASGSIYAQRFSATGQPVGAELHLDGTQGGSALWVSVAATANDGFVIAFQAGSFAQAEIFGHRYDSANNPVGGLFAVNSTSPNEQFNPHIVTLDGGALLYTWDTRFTGGNGDVFQEVRGRIFLADGQALAADFPIAPMSASVENGLSAIAPLPGGGFVVTWQTGTPMGTDNFEIVAQRFTSTGAPLGSPFQVNTSTPNSQYGNDVARLSDGGFVVSWVDAPGGNGGGRILARHYDASGAAIGGEILIDSKASGGYGRTTVTALADGGYVVSWTEADGANNNVLARAFGSNDVALDAAFEMSFDSPFGANYFSDGAVTLPNGNVVFAWDGPSVTPPGGQGTGQDIYMRVYNFSGAPPQNGTPGPDQLNGTAGDDTLNGLGGDDRLDGGPGADLMNGGPGNDVFIVDDAGDRANEAPGDGSDTVFSGVSHALAAGQEIEVLDVLDRTGTGALQLTGNEYSQTIIGNAGNNVLNGGGGPDIFYGLGGNDAYFVWNAGDVVIEAAGQGVDTVYSLIGSYTLIAGQEIEVLSTFDRTATFAQNLTGNALGQALIGNAGANLLNGNGGTDIFYGLGGNDVFIVDSADDLVFEAAGQGQDTIYTMASYALAAGQEIEVLDMFDRGGTGALNLTGNALSQALVGNAGANVLDGGAGADVLYGLGGADTFAFTTAPGAGNIDTIADFVSGTDKVALDDAVFTAIGPVGALGANAFVTGTGAADGDDRIIYNSATGALLYDADGTGGIAAVQFATLSTGLTLAASDFTLI